MDIQSRLEAVEQAPHTWYPVLHEICLHWADKYGYDLGTIIGVFALLSPQKDIQSNIQQCIEVLEHGKPLTGMFSRKQVDSIRRVLNGEDFTEVAHKNSHKIRNFYASILCPYEDGPCCIDTHIIRYLKRSYPYSLLNKYTREQIFSSKRLYNHCVRLLSRESTDLIPSAYQAKVWTEVRGAAF